MALKVKKRKKSGRMRGSHTHARGGKKKARGSGHQGGVGMAGTGKRGDQKKSLILKKTLPQYFGKRQTKMSFSKNKLKTLNLARFVNSITKSGKEVEELNLKDLKIIGILTQPLKLTIHAGSASENAIKSVKKHGGEIILKEKLTS